MKKTLSGLIAILGLFACFSMGQEAQEIIQLTNPPSSLNISHDSRQQVTMTFVMPSLAPERRGWQASEIMRLLKQDGETGGIVRAGLATVGGETMPTVTVSCTEKMMATIAGVVPSDLTLEQLREMAETRGLTLQHWHSPGTVLTEPIVPRYQSIEFLAEKVRGLLSEVGSLDVGDHVLVIEDNPVDLAFILTRLEVYDSPAFAKTFEVTVIEAEKGFSQRLGLYWGALQKAAPAGIDLKFTADPWVSKTNDIDYNGAEANINNINPRALFDFVSLSVAKGKARVAKKTTLAIQNNEEGTFYGGYTTPYRVSDDGKTYIDRTYNDGLSVTFNAIITSEQTTLHVTATNTAIVDNDLTSDQPPRLSRSELKTTIQVADGQSYILSGLNTVRTENTRTGVPGLSAVPVIGYPFGRTTKVDKEQEVYIILRSLSQGEQDATIAGQRQIEAERLAPKPAKKPWYCRKAKTATTGEKVQPADAGGQPADGASLTPANPGELTVRAVGG